MHFFSKESRSTHFTCCYAISLLKLHKYQCKDKSTLKEMLVSYLLRSSPIAMLIIYLTSSLTSLTEVRKSVLEKLGALVHLSQRGLSFRFFHFRPSGTN